MKGDNPWFYLSERLGHMMAPLVGANEKEVIVTGSTTINLHQMLSTFYRPTSKRYKILTEELSFPSDIYAIKSHLVMRGYTNALTLVKTRDGRCILEEDIIQAMTEDVALIILPTVLYQSGQLLDIKKLTCEAQQRNILIGFDASHSVGAVPHSFHEWGVDFSFWCTYKYLNGGPGSVGALFLHEKHQGRSPGMAGWFSSKKTEQFDMGHTLIPAEDAGAFQVGTPHILSAAPLLGSLTMMNETTIQAIRKKSLQLTAYLMQLIEEELREFHFVIGTPVEEARRGGHVSIEHPEAIQICKALKDMKVVPDFRKPHVIRLAPAALYTSYEDVFIAVRRLKEIMLYRTYENYAKEREVIA
jgi:kynureninase